MAIKLSICIPTYNRGQFIGKTLKSILKQKNEQVEVVIVDDGSNDNTREVVESYQKQHKGVRYYYQRVNYGVDHGMVRAVQFARGEYCWLMSSDDLLKEGAINAILEECQKGYSLIIVNSEIKNFDLSKKLQEKTLNIKNNIIYRTDDWEKFFIETANYLTYMPCLVVRRDLWDSREKEKYYGTGFLHVGVIFQKPILGKMLALAHPLITNRYGNFAWSSRRFEFAMFKWPDLVWSFPQFSQKAKQKICPRGSWPDIPRHLYFRSLGILSPQDINAYLQKYKVGGLKKYLIKIIPHLPGRILNFLAIFYYSVIAKSELEIYLLKNSPGYFFGKK